MNKKSSILYLPRSDCERNSKLRGKKSGERRKKIPHKHITLAFLGVTTPLRGIPSLASSPWRGKYHREWSREARSALMQRTVAANGVSPASAFELLPAAIEIRENRVLNRLTSDGIKTAAGRFAPKFSIFENFPREGFSRSIFVRRIFPSSRLVMLATVDT